MKHAAAQFTWKRKLLFVLVWNACAFACASAAFVIAMAACPSVPPPPVWTSAIASTPDDFTYLMFPTSTNVPLCDAPSGAAVATLDRAVANTQKEVRTGGWLTVNSANGVRWVELSKLAFDTDAALRDTMLERFSIAYKERHAVEMGTAHVQWQQISAARTEVRLTIRPDDDHVYVYVYDLVDGVPTPREKRTYFGPGVAMMNLDGVVYGAIAAACTYILMNFAKLVVMARAIRPGREYEQRSS